MITYTMNVEQAIKFANTPAQAGVFAKTKLGMVPAEDQDGLELVLLVKLSKTPQAGFFPLAELKKVLKVKLAVLAA